MPSLQVILHQNSETTMRLLLFILIQTNELSKSLIVGWPRSYTTLSSLTARKNISQTADDSRLRLKRLPSGSFSDVERIIACVNHALHIFISSSMSSSLVSAYHEERKHAAFFSRSLCLYLYLTRIRHNLVICTFLHQ